MGRLLRHVHSAEKNYGGDKDQRLAWFVILDEMNLARVEYYFADLLSVLESGRSTDGWTREPLTVEYPDDAEGELPARNLRLPPNLYFVGTVNVDETTHAFSPKVLDRAFALELTDVDFSEYPPRKSEDDRDELTRDEREQLLRGFTSNRRFDRTSKDVVDGYFEKNGAEGAKVRVRLQRLNGLLTPHNFHFGYRVFDEIVAFLAAAKENGLFAADVGDPFDAAVLMKVLPKFHGSRGKLETPLREVIAWCCNPEGGPEFNEKLLALEKAANESEPRGAVQDLLTQPFTLRRTAERAGRMLIQLYAEGFAAYG